MACSNILLSKNISDFFSFNMDKNISFIHQEKNACYHATFIRIDRLNNNILIILVKISSIFVKASVKTQF